MRPTLPYPFPTKKVILWSVTLLLVMGLLSTCNGGFNLIMYNHLKKSDSYITCTATVTDISRDRNGYPYLRCVFDDRSVATRFNGADLAKGADPESYWFALSLPDESYDLLSERGFFESFSAGDTLTITASPFIYMDGNFFYVAALTHNGTEYLSFDEGLTNIKRMMRRNPSML